MLHYRLYCLDGTGASAWLNGLTHSMMQMLSAKRRTLNVAHSSAKFGAASGW
jgi:hypothetical protein